MVGRQVADDVLRCKYVVAAVELRSRRAGVEAGLTGIPLGPIWPTGGGTGENQVKPFASCGRGPHPPVGTNAPHSGRSCL